MTKITRERLLKIQQWRETYGTGSNVMLPAEEAEELARIVLASLEAEPVSQTYNLPELIEGMEVSIDVSTCDADAGNRYFGTVTEVSELYTARNGYILLVQDAEPNFDVNGNSPVQSPIDHGYRPECECSGCKATARICAELNNEEAGIFADGYNVGLLPCPFCGSPAEHYPDGDMEGYIIMCGNKNGDCNLQTFGFTTPEEAEKAWNTRAAIPQTGNFRENPISSTNNFRKIADTSTNSPAIPDGYALVPAEPTDEMIAAAMNCEDMLFNSDESFCVQFGNIYEAMLAAAPKPQNAPQNIPENIHAEKSTLTPDGWISCSERMPEDEQEVIVQNKLGYRYVSYFDEHSGLFFDMPGGNQMNCIEHILVTHWMPLPEPPQQESNSE